jgi:hypothetical protein
VSRSSDILEVPLTSPGAFPEGTGGTGPVIAPHLEAANNELNAIAVRDAEQRAKEVAAANEREEAKAREDSLLAKEESARKFRKEKEAKMATGGVSLAATNLTVQGNGTALVKLTCLGIASCHGKLTLTAKGAIEARGTKGTKTRSVSVGGLGALRSVPHARARGDHGR